jgi:type IV conjugative transfer system coupling protein TraD
MSKVLTSTAALATAAVVGYAFTHNPIGPAVAAAAMGLVLHAKYSGSDPKEKQFGDTVRGALVDSKTKRKGRALSDQVSIGGIPIPRDCEPQHFLAVGGTGTGKTVACEAVLDVARARKERAVVYDPTGVLVSHYYREGQDVILSPIDSRSVLWTPWAEGETAYAYENIAKALVPDALGENQFWSQAGRAIFRAALTSTTNLPALIDLVFGEDQDFLLSVLQSLRIVGLAGPENMLASSRGTCATYIQPLAYLPPAGDKEPFSIRKWVRDESSDSWLFIPAREDVREAIRPLMSMWLGIAVQAGMSLPQSHSRRLWFILDELPTLQKLPSLDTVLAGGRKYGITCLLGIQAIAQLREVYGHDGAAALLSHPSTRLTLRVNDFETAEYLSKSLGDRHTIRKVTSESRNTGGGGQSTSEQHSIEAAVLSSEIMSLPNLVGYLRVPNDPVIKKIKLVRRERQALADLYQDRELDLSAAPPIPQTPPPADVTGLTRAPASPALDTPGADLDGPDLPDL